MSKQERAYRSFWRCKEIGTDDAIVDDIPRSDKHVKECPALRS